MLNNLSSLRTKKKILILSILILISFTFSSFLIKSSTFNKIKYATKTNKTANTHTKVNLEITQSPIIQDNINYTQWPIYFLFTKENLINSFILNTSNINVSPFDYSLKTYFIIHGFVSHANTTWINEIKDNILKNEIVNVILVEWKEASKYAGEVYFSESSLNPREYVKAAKNAKLLGIRIAQFITITNINHTNLHCIGHSLGAHGNLNFNVLLYLYLVN